MFIIQCSCTIVRCTCLQIAARYFPRRRHPWWTDEVNHAFYDRTKMVVLPRDFDTMQPCQPDRFVCKPSHGVTRYFFMEHYNLRRENQLYGSYRYIAIRAARLINMSPSHLEFYWMMNEVFIPSGKRAQCRNSDVEKNAKKPFPFCKTFQITIRWFTLHSPAISDAQ